MDDTQKLIFDQMVQPLLAWYTQNARVLPWRENRLPYRVWVSEIMLQQTRVEAVKPYFERFMQQLPTLQSLAEAEEETLLKLWEGLGYYSRVRNLQKAAQIICREQDGVFPEIYQEILNLPGIGAYTAGAISSICFEKPIPAVDGNVLRVLTRLTEDYRQITDGALKEELTAALQSVYPQGRCGDFCQSLMELGAVICTPNGSPKCAACPLRHLCLANRKQTQALLPVKAKKPPRTVQPKTVLLLCFDHTIAVRKRQAAGLLGGLWEFPNAEGALSSQEVAAWLQTMEIAAGEISRQADQKHIFTHVEWQMRCYLVDCRNSCPDFLWVTKEVLQQEISLPTAFRKFADLWQG